MVDVLLFLHDGCAQARIFLVLGAGKIKRVSSDRFDDLLKEGDRFGRTEGFPSHTVDDAGLEVIERAAMKTERINLTNRAIAIRLVDQI